MCLTTKWGVMITVPTVCQTWRCPRCGSRRKSYASLRAEHGSTLLEWPGPLKLITVTYRMTGTHDLVTARSALTDFRRFVQLLRRRSESSIRWFRVPEVTRLGQIHWHVISGDLVGERFELERLVRDCWALASRKEGKVINHVVDVSPTSAKGSAHYVAKYLLKSALSFQTLQERGFTRRWSCSRNWTKPGPIELVGTAEDSWVRHEFVKPLDSPEEIARGRRTAKVSRVAQRTGDHIVLAIQKRGRDRVLATQFAKILGGTNGPVPTRNSPTHHSR